MKQVITLVSILVALSCQNPTTGDSGSSTVGNTGPAAKWLKAPIAYNSDSKFNALDKDSSGNLYCVGDFAGASTITFGTGVTLTGQDVTQNAALVKYNSSGTALWARAFSTSADIKQSYYERVFVQSSGDILVIGSSYSTGVLDFGNGVTLSDPGTNGNSFVVKYDSSGLAQWAHSLAVGPYSFTYGSIVADSTGNIYVSGGFSGTGTYDFGNSVGITGSGAGTHGFVLKLNSSGTSQWARTTVSETGPTNGYTYYAKLLIDSSSNVIAVGSVAGAVVYDFGNSITLTGVATGNNSNLLILKYSPAGNALSAKTLVSGEASGSMDAVLDSNENLIIVGAVAGSSTANFGNGVTLSVNRPAGYVDGLIVKYNAAGSCLWARNVTGLYSIGLRIAVNSIDEIYAAFVGMQDGVYDFGNGVKNKGSCTTQENPFLVKYTAAGLPLWSNSSVSGGRTGFVGLACVGTDVYAAGLGAQGVNFGSGLAISTGGTATQNAFLIKY